MNTGMGERVNPKWAKTGERLKLLVATTELNDVEFVATLKDYKPEVTPKAWSKYQKGTRELPRELAGKLYLDYGASMEWLFLGIAEPNSPGFKARLAKVLREGVKPPSKASPASKGPRPAGARKRPQGP